MITQQKSRKLTRALVHPPSRYFQTLDMKQPQFPSYNYPSNKTVTLNPFSKKSIDKTLQAYAQDLPSKKFLQRRITMKDLKNSSRRTKRNSSVDKIESVTLVRASRQSRQSRDYSMVDSSQGRLKYMSTNKDKAESVLDRYRRSSLSSPYKDNLDEKRRAISRTHDTVTLKQPISITPNLLQVAKRLYKQNKLDEAIITINEIPNSRKSSESEYILGLCYMNKGSYEKSIKIFEKIIASDPAFKKNIYLLIGIGYKKQNLIDSSIKILTRGLEHFPDYFDCLVYRGKLYLKVDQPENSLQDFERASEICPEKGFPWIGKAEALKSLGRIKQGIQALNQAFGTEARSIARLKRAQFYLQCMNYDQALKDINQYLQVQQSNEAFYYKGLILKNMKQSTEALMIWQQITKDYSDDVFVQKAAEEIVKLKIQEKDFYEASFILTRFKYPMVAWRVFVQASLLLMKKKYGEGLEMYNSPQLFLYTKTVSSALKQLATQQQKARYYFLKPLVHLYRAYGYFCLNNLPKAMNDYKLYDEFHAHGQKSSIHHNSSKQYNQCLIEAITKFHQNSEPYLQKALRFYPNKSEPYVYLAMCGVQKYLIEQQPSIVQKVKQNLDKAVNYLPQLSNNHVSSVYYHRAVISLYMNQFQSSVTDIDKAIEKSEDNIPKYFYLRGLIFACCSNFSQAIQDYTVCINLDSNFSKAFIERAKCVQMEGNITEAFNDLQKYISLNPNDPLINQYAASLLFQNCAYSDCLVALSHSKIDSVENHLTKAKCHLMIGDLQKSIQFFSSYLSMRSTNGSPSFDLDILKLINGFSTTTEYQKADETISEMINSKDYEGQLFHITDLLVLRGCVKCCMGKYEESENDFLSALSLKEIFHRKDADVIEITEEEENGDIGWSIGQVYYCLSIVALSQKKYKIAYEYFIKSESDEIFRQNQWSKYKALLSGLENNSPSLNQLVEQFNKSQVDIESCTTFMTKSFKPIWIDLPNTKIKLPLILAYPQMQSPSLTPQFDHELLSDFKANIVQPKPQAPWITRKVEGVVFTSNVQIFDNLQLSMTSLNSNQKLESHNSMESHQSVEIITKEKMKQRFKLDAAIQSKLNKLLDKKRKQQN